MSLKDFRKSIAVIMFLGLALGGITYGINMTNTISQLKADSAESLDQLQETQRQLSELSDSYYQMSDQGPRYTGNPFATELWPGQLQSENITGMHWYSYYGGELVNVTDNVLGEGDYTTWTNVWKRDYGAGATLMSLNVDNDGRVYTTDLFGTTAYLKDYSGAEVNTANYIYLDLTMEMSTGMGPARTFSLTEKYVLGINMTIMTQVDIWRDGVNITTVNPLLDEPDTSALWDIQISPNGKFIAFIVVSTATANNRYVLLYEGS